MKNLTKSGRRFGGKVVGTGVNQRDDGRAGFGCIERALRHHSVPFSSQPLSFRRASIVACLPFVFDERVLLAGRCMTGLGLSGNECLDHSGSGTGGGGGGDGGKHVAATAPEEIGEAAAVGVAGGVDAAFIDLVVGLERGEDGVEEFEVAVAEDAAVRVASRSFCLRVGERPGVLRPCM